MPVSRVLISVVVLLFLGAVFIACGLGVVPYIIKQKLDTVGSIDIIAVIIKFFCMQTHTLYAAAILSRHTVWCSSNEFGASVKLLDVGPG